MNTPKTPRLDRLVTALHDAFERGPRGAEITRLLGDYARGEDDWRAFALFSDVGYTRNLVVREERFELMLLCWSEGQESPIHNHEGQDCWMAVMEGRMEEQRFAMPVPGASGPLPPRESLRFESGQVAFIRDEMGLHLVRPAGGAGVTMHLYSAPYDECDCYCPETGRVTRKRLAHHSIRGRVLEPRQV